MQYTTLAARQAFKSHGERYANYIELHTLSLIADGKLPGDAINWTLGRRLQGNDSL